MGRLETIKDLPGLIGAIAPLPVYLWVIGDGPEKDRIESVLQSNGLGDRFRLLGQQADVSRLLRCCDLYVSASRSESFGMAVAEALREGLAVVATDVGGIREVTGDGRYARLVPPADPVSLRAAVAWAIHHPGEMRDQAQEGRDFVIQEFDTQRLAERQHCLYEALLR